MPGPTYFVQECPTCGRHLQIRVEYLGRKVVCQHCRGTLVATDPSLVRVDPSQSSTALLRRAEELLETVSRPRSAPPGHINR